MFVPSTHIEHLLRSRGETVRFGGLDACTAGDAMDLGFIHVGHDRYVLFGRKFPYNINIADSDFLIQNGINTINNSINFAFQEKNDEGNQRKFISKLIAYIEKYKILPKYYLLTVFDLHKVIEDVFMTDDLFLTDFHDYANVINKNLKSKIYTNIRNYIEYRESVFLCTDEHLLSKIKNFYSKEKDVQFIRKILPIYYSNKGKFKSSLFDINGGRIADEFESITEKSLEIFYPKYVNEFYMAMLAFDYDDPKGFEYLTTSRILKQSYILNPLNNLDSTIAEIISLKKVRSLNNLCHRMRSSYNWNSVSLIGLLPFTKFSNNAIWFYEQDMNGMTEEYIEYLFNPYPEYKYGKIS